MNNALRILSFLVIFLTPLLGYGQIETLFWTNAAGDQNWANAMNWSEDDTDPAVNNRVPTNCDEVIIRDGHTVEVQNTGPIANKIVLIDNATLNILSGNLTIDNKFDCDGIIFVGDGTLNIAEGASLNIQNTAISAIAVQEGSATITNAGNITIERTSDRPVEVIGSAGIIVASLNIAPANLNLTNQSTGVIRNIDTLFSEFIFIHPSAGNNSAITNHGLIDIHHTDEVFRPDFGGLIDAGVFVFLQTTTLDNYGMIQIDSIDGDAFVLFENSRITNHQSGKLTLMDIEETSINLSDNATFINDGSIRITQNLGGDFGAAEAIDLDDNTAIFTNNGFIELSGTEDAEAIDIDGQFNNNGLINIGLAPSADEAIGVNSAGILTNAACAIINIITADSIDNDMGTINNRGIITTLFTGTNSNTGVFKNDGVIQTPNGTFLLAPNMLTGMGLIRSGNMPSALHEIQGRDIFICNAQMVNLDSLISGTRGDHSRYGTVFGTYSDTITKSVLVNNSTTFFIEESITATGCMDTTQVNIEVIPPPNYFVQPENDTICYGGTVSFDAFAIPVEPPNGLPLILITRWQESADGINFSDISDGTLYSGATTNTLTLTGVKADRNNYKYRQITTQEIANISCSDTSDVAMLQVVRPLINQQVENDTICDGEGALFTVKTTPNNAGTLSYQWQVSSNNGVSFTNLNDGMVYAGSTTDSLKLVNVDMSYINTQYRLIITETVGNHSCKDTTIAGKLLLNAINAGSIAADQTICVGGDVAAFTSLTDATGTGNLSYQWRLNGNNIAGAVDKVYDHGVINIPSHFERVAISTLNNHICTAISNQLQINVDELSLGGQINLSPSSCDGTELVELTLSGHRGTIQNWQSATSMDFMNPMNIAHTDISYTVQNFEETTYYRAIVKNGNCPIIASESMIVQMPIFGPNQTDECPANVGIIGVFNKQIPTGTYRATQKIASPGTIKAGNTVTFKAGESITLYACFTAEAGSNFSAKIEACVPNQNAAKTKTTQLRNSKKEKKRAIGLDVFPNPAAFQTEIVVDLPKTDRISLFLFDQAGRRIKTLLNQEEKAAGRHFFPLTRETQAGMYFIVLQSAKARMIKKLVFIDK
jgi:hypothetical protein